MKSTVFLRPALLGLALLPLAACDDAPDTASATAYTAATRDALALLPQGAPLVAMLDVDEAESVGAFRDALAQFERAGGEAHARMGDLTRRTGFDPARDLDRVYFAVLDDEAPLFVVQAKMDRERLIGFLDEQPEMERSAYRDLPVFTAVDDADRFTVALLSNDLALAGLERHVRAAADRALDGGPSAATDAGLTAILDRARYGEAWLVQRGGMPDQQDFQVASGVVSMDFGADGVQVAAVAEPAAGASAADLADALEGAVAMARVQAVDRPELRELLDDVDVRTRDGVVEVRGALSNAYLAQMQAR